MKEIKFRAWSKKQKELYAWEYYPELILSLIPAAYNYNKIDEDYILMQFTGLKDKNDVEIYEGDILHFSFGMLTMDGYVKQKDCGEWVFYKDESNCLGVQHNLGRIEIIDNIHENPELMEKL